MKTFEAVGNSFSISPVQKKLACRGSSNSETVRFRLDRYAGKADLSACNCTVKTRNSEGTSDLAVPEVTADDRKLSVDWTLSSGSAAVAGPLLVQLQFEKIYDDSSKNVVWQSGIMEFEISDSLDDADEIIDREPTLFQQWEERVNTAYSDVSAGVQSVQALQSQVQADADAVAQQKQSAEQAAAQASQSAQEAAESEQSAAASATEARASAEQAQGSAADAQTAQGLANGYSNAAKTYSDAAAVGAQSAQTSAQTAQQQAEAAQQAAAEAQRKVDSFSGYSKEEIDNGFACALIGEATGQSITLDDVQPGTNFRSVLIAGQTLETGSGNKSPDDPYSLRGTAEFYSFGRNLFDAAKSPNAGNHAAVSDVVAGGFTVSDTAAGSFGNVQFVSRLAAGAAYTLSAHIVGGNQAGIQIYNSSNTSIVGGSNKNSPDVSMTFVVPNDGAVVLKFLCNTRSDVGQYSAVFSSIQLELRDAATAYAPFQGLQTVTLPAPLYSLPNGAADAYEAVAGQGTRRIKEVVWNASGGSGNGSWAFSGEKSNPDTACFFYSAESDLPQTGAPVVSDKLPCADDDSDAEHIRYVLSDHTFCIFLLKSRLAGWSDAWTSEQKAAALESWLSANPITVLYQLESPAAIQGSPAEIPAYAPQSSIAADGARSIALRYNRDINAVLAKLEAELQSLRAG